MTRFIETTAIALALSVSSLAAAQAAQLNTIPLNAQGQPVGNKPVTTAAGLQANTTIGSSLNVPKTVVTTAAGLQANTTIGSSLNVPKTVVTTAAGLQANTTIGSSLNVPKTVVTTAAGLPAITYGTFAVPNIKATIATGAIPVPKQGGAYNAATGGGAAFADESGSGGDGFINGIYKVGVATVGAFGARAVITIAGWTGATGATAAGTTVVSQGTAGAVGANTIVGTETLTLTEEAIVILGAPAGF
jgi:hypothetical protein